MQEPQSIRNHKRIHPIQHFFWLPLGGLTILTALASLIVAMINGGTVLTLLLILATAIIALISGFLARRNALIVQDRVIRIEEQFRYFRLTGNMPSFELTIRQWIALRFASDKEFPMLADQAGHQDLSPEQIKQTIQDWREDNYRV
ncbi:DUF6526 family protein [Paenibacillus silvae]|uniref:DUF6526 family protein n=1 Tax=Paenibacillus silvae TaxID=1325358 RepID=UPI0025A18A6F|nr:DUF6526 family protein [Paenibacillus silvae]MDM5277433.1 DUF6526 family protein [Paenibacillus silvae]